VPLEYHPTLRKPRATITTTATAATALITGTLDVISGIADHILAMTTVIDVIIAATIAAMIDATTTITMTKMTGATTTRVIVVTTSVTTDEKIGAMIDVVKTTTIVMTTIGKSGLCRMDLPGPTTSVGTRSE
jgi:hypothetical protein